MGQNSIPSAIGGTIIPAEHHNSLRSSWLQNLVPRNLVGIATDIAGSIGTSVLKWTNVFSERVTIGQNANIEFNEDTVNNELVCEIAGIEVARFHTDGILPPGMIVPYSLTTAPKQWLLCEGQAVSRITYERLWLAIGTTYGEGDGSTTFNTPNFKGRFLRGRANGSGNDPDRGSRAAMTTGGNTGDNIGSVQNDAIKEHNHPINSGGNAAGVFTGLNTAGASPQTGQTFSVLSGDNETRAKNAYVSFIIKI